MGVLQFLNRKAGKASLGRWPLSDVLKEAKERALQAEGMASAKALGLACAWSIQGLARRPQVWSR